MLTYCINSLNRYLLYIQFIILYSKIIYKTNSIKLLNSVELDSLSWTLSSK